MNPVALVTGGGVRVGRAIALGLVESGYDLVVSYNSSATGAAEVATAAAHLGRRVHPAQADLSCEEDVVRLARSVADRFGRLDLLVNSASSFVANDLLAVTVEEWDAVMAVNLRAPFLLVRETAELLKRHPGIGREHRGPVRPAALDQPPSPLGLEGGAPPPHQGDGPSARAPCARQTRLRPGTCCRPRTSARRTSSATGGACHWAGSAHRTTWWARCGSLAGADYVTGEVIVVDGGLGMAG